MVMSWIFAGIALGAVFVATVVQQLRRAILALWIAGLAIGSIYLTIGAEFLAITQWIVSTLVTISFIFFAVMFGEYNTSEEVSSDCQGTQKNWFFFILSWVLGIGFGVVIWMGAEGLPWNVHETEWFHFQGMDHLSELEKLGKQLIREHLLTLEVFALLLFLVLVGGGVVARSEGEIKE